MSIRVLLVFTIRTNENKPVTNSRDTQEVPFQEGLNVMNIFKEYPATTSVLDDFEYYDKRETEQRLKKEIEKKVEMEKAEDDKIEPLPALNKKDEAIGQKRRSRGPAKRRGKPVLRYEKVIKPATVPQDTPNTIVEASPKPTSENTPEIRA